MFRAITTSLILFIHCSAFGQRDCILKKDKDSIRVYTCSSEQSKFRAIKAEFTVDATLSEMGTFLLDVSNYVNWQYNTVKSTIVKDVSDHEVIFYNEIEAPWPVSNRDMVVDISVSQDKKSKVLTVASKSLPKLLPENLHLVRVPMTRSVWTIQPLSSTKLKVDYYILIDPGGSVPPWMVNMVSTQAPYESFKKLKVKIREHSPSEVKRPFILDL